jgi:hypothetical protein
VSDSDHVRSALDASRDDHPVITEQASRECPVCGESFAVHPGPGRPRIYCTEKCRWKAGHQADTRARHKLMAEQNRQSYDDLLAWAGRQHFREPY